MRSAGQNLSKNGVEVIKNIYYFSEIPMMDCNVYCIVDSQTKEIALFDAGNGMSLKPLFEGLLALDLDYNNITKVFLTHEHLDHVIGLFPLMKIMKYNPPELFAYGQTANILKEGDENKIFPRMLQRQLGISARDMGIEVGPLEVNDISSKKEIQINSEFTFHIHHTPGHSFGSVCYYEPTKKILIPGDLIFIRGNFGRYDFPGCSLTSLQNSIKNMNDLDVKYLLPGHMGISENGNEQIQLSYKIVMSLKDYS